MPGNDVAAIEDRICLDLRNTRSVVEVVGYETKESFDPFLVKLFPLKFQVPFLVLQLVGLRKNTRTCQFRELESDLLE